MQLNYRHSCYFAGCLSLQSLDLGLNIDALNYSGVQTVLVCFEFMFTRQHSGDIFLCCYVILAKLTVYQTQSAMYRVNIYTLLTPAAILMYMINGYYFTFFFKKKTRSN